MRSGPAWDDSEDRGQALESARDAARRAGMSLGQWLDSVIRASAAESPPLAASAPPPPRSETVRPPTDPAAGLVSPPAAPAPHAPDRLSRALDDLSARIDHLLQPPPLDRAAAPSPSASEIERAVAEIVARQHALETAPVRARAPAEAAPRTAPEPRIPEAAAPALSPDLSGLHEQLRQLTAQIAAMNRPCGMESAIGELRRELAEIWRAVTEAMPRRALEALESEVRALSARIDAERRRPTDTAAIDGLARGLAEVRDALSTLTPAEGLAGLEQTIKTLAVKIDKVAANGIGETALHQIQASIAGLRDVVAGAASSDTLSALMSEVHAIAAKIERLAVPDMRPTMEALSSKIERLAQSDVRPAVESISSKIEQLAKSDLRPAVESISRQLSGIADKFERTGAGPGLGESDIAARIARGTDDIAAKIDELLRAGPAPGMESISGQLSDLSHKLENSSAGRSGFEQIEAQIRDLMGRLDSAGPPQQTLEQIERTVNNLALQLGEARITAVDAAERAAKAVVREVMSAPNAANDEVYALKNDISELRHFQSANDERTRSTLEAVHRTLERLVDRLGSLESARREELQTAAKDSWTPPPAFERLVDRLTSLEAARREEQDIKPAVARSVADEPAAGAPARDIRPGAAAKTAAWQAREPRPIDPTLPADTPLEPGTVTPRARAGGLAERSFDIPADPAPLTAAEKPFEARENPAGPAPVSRSSFVAAARRAAQAAQAESSSFTAATAKAPGQSRPRSPGFIASRRRPILIGIAAVLVLVAIVRVVTTFLAPASMTGGQDTHAPAPPSPPVTNGTDAPAGAPPAPPGANKQSGLAPVTRPVPTAIPSAGSIGSVEPMPFTSGEPTGTVAAPATSVIPSATTFEANSVQADPPAARASSERQAVTSRETLPAGIGAQALRHAAESGDAAAAYEIGVRYAEGRGVAQNLPEAVRWFERASSRGLAPAQYRLGSMFEKGLGVKKDVEAARRLYVAASEKGNAKAMHNLAVLHAEGIDGKPDYANAATWFRRAADRGVADSQYNLGILYARGIGVAQNLAESYKWFALAAAQGDQDAGKKREEIAQRLDSQSLVAARLAVQTWTAQPQPEEAVSVKAPGAGSAPQNAGQTGRGKPPQRKS